MCVFIRRKIISNKIAHNFQGNIIEFQRHSFLSYLNSIQQMNELNRKKLISTKIADKFQAKIIELKDIYHNLIEMLTKR